MKAQQYDTELSLLMIDVTSSCSRHLCHPEGDACLTRLGETLAGIAAETMALPAAMAARNSACCCRTDAVRAREIGEMVRAAVEAWRCSLYLQPPDRHRQRRVGLHQAQRLAAAGRSDRGRRRRALCRQASRP